MLRAVEAYTAEKGLSQIKVDIFSVAARAISKEVSKISLIKPFQKK